MYHGLYYEFIAREATVGDIINSRRETSPAFEGAYAIREGYWYEPRAFCAMSRSLIRIVNV